MKRRAPSILLFAACALCSRLHAATYYVRTDGGSSTECTGLVDAAYPGSGTAQPCGWKHPFWALDNTGAWRISGGDTLVIDAGSYRMGIGAPNTGWCDPSFPWDCHLPPLPSGPSAGNPTRVLGGSWATGCQVKPELWGAERSYQVIDLTSTNNAVIACLEITDHQGCVESHGNPAVACERNNPPYGDWAPTGLVASDSSNVVLRDLDIHGMANQGIWAGRLSGWMCDHVRLAGNGWAGWNGDIGASSSNSGSMVFSHFVVEWNGCAETYPGKQPDHCWAQLAGGYGDGLGTASTGGDWDVSDSLFQYNTSDGLDLLYLGVSGQPATAIIRRTVARSNAGNQIKVAASATVVNCLLVGECAFFTGKPFAQEMQTDDNCRALGNSLALSPHQGDQVAVVNSTIGGQGDCLVEMVCDTADCNGTESVTLENDVFRGDTDWRQSFELTCYLYYDNALAPSVANDYNTVFNVKDGNNDCAAGSSNTCTSDPLLVDANLSTFDGHLQAGSPSIDTGLPVGGLIPADDLDLRSRPIGSGVDRGAYEYSPNVNDYLVGQGLGPPNPNRVRVFTSQGTASSVDFLAYGANQWGVNGSTADLDGGAYDEMLTGPGPGVVYGPQVRGFRRDGTAMGKVSYYAYGTLRYGVNVAGANLDADGFDEIETGAGPGVVFGPHVRGWNFDGTALTPIAKISFFAYGTLKYGVNVEGGSVDADGYEEILTGPGPGVVFGPQVRGFDYDAASVTAIAKINFNAFTTTQYGVNVAGGSVDGDLYAEIATAPGPGPGAAFSSRFLGYNYDAATIGALAGFDVTPFVTHYGGRVGLADVASAGRDALLAGAGRDPAADSRVDAYAYSGAALTIVPGSFVPFGTATYGVNVAGGLLGY